MKTLNMHRLTKENAPEILKLVEKLVGAQSGAIEKIHRTKNMTHKAKAAALMHIHHEAHMKAGEKFLKLKVPKKAHTSPMAKVGGLMAKWDECHQAIGAWLLRNTNKQHDPTPLGLGLVALLKKLNKAGAAIAPDYKGRRKWWLARDFNRAKMTNIGNGCLMTDAKALQNRKQFIRQFLKPHSTTNIPQLNEGGVILRTPREIEGGLHDFLGRMAGSPEPREQFDWTKHTTNPGLVDVMRPVDMQELRLLMPDLDATSAAGELPTALVKLTAMGTYEEEVVKTKKEREREYRHETDGDRHQPVGIDADGAPIARAPDINPTKTVERRPEGALKLLKLIINHSLEARTIPETEKYNTVTGLPKGEGQVTSTAKMRPISVGPVIGKIINKLIAYRLARSLIASDSMDKAQFAFLPGLSIHEAINSVLACFKQSTKAKPNTAEKACYAAFYDISKAYDTIRWSSIERALRQKGAPRELIDFVMNSLEGTTLTMKTNSHGGRTRAVKVHQAIKQGC